MFEWKDILFGEHGSEFILEVLVRTSIMFLVVLLGLRILGKRGVKQLSVFELVVIIGLGSAAGDPMFYKEVGIIPAVIVFAVIIVMYYLVTLLVVKSSWFENLIEGKPACLLEDGVFTIDNFRKELLADDEFFSELRVKSISHLGQVKMAIVETSGEISIYYYADEEVKYGLPIIPKLFEQKLEAIPEPGHYSCSFCGNTEELKPILKMECNVCKKHEWVKSINETRIN